MKVFLAGLAHETSAFSPVPTDVRSFEEFIAYRPPGNRIDDAGLALNGYGDFAREAAASGDEVFASSYFWAQPSGPCRRVDYEALRDEVLADLRRAGPVDLVLLFLHGAQMAEGEADCEGDLLARVRAIVGPGVFVGVLLDLHANVTTRMIEAASALVACRNYPHTDFGERAVELYRLGRRCAAGEVAPHSRFERLPMIGMFYTTEPLMARANAAARALENEPGVLSVSLIHGFLWADMDEMGAGVLVITDGPRPDLRPAVRQIGRLFFEARAETRVMRVGVDAALDTVEAGWAADAGDARPFVVADACDNAGGGAGSDSTFILARILERGLAGYAVALLWDPIALRFAEAAGEGALFRLRLGGKTGPEAGLPLDVEARVLALRTGLEQRGIGFTAPVGNAAALAVAGNIVIVNDVRGQVFSPSCFADLGIDPTDQRALVVKSTQHFREQFEPLARAIVYCETPGVLALDIDPARYRNLPRPLWPLDTVDYPA